MKMEARPWDKGYLVGGLFYLFVFTILLPFVIMMSGG
jgi:hypothetical protein